MNSATHHISPLRLYLGIGTILLILTVITVLVASYDLGVGNLVVALTIASIKALLVAFFFMHLYYDSKLYFLIFSIAILTLTIFIVFTMFDTLRRDDIEKNRAFPTEKQAIIHDQSPETTSQFDTNSAVMDTIAAIEDSTGR